jgi:acylphosphatase
MQEKIRAHVLVFGKVQGVFYRQGAKEKAKDLGVFGWVKNLNDGSVEAVFEGEKESVKKMLQWAKTGTFSSAVKDIKMEFAPYKGEFLNFEIKHDSHKK